MEERLRYSDAHRTAWRHAYNVYRGDRYLGLVYRGDDNKWHAMADDGYREGGWNRRTDAVFALEQPR